MMAEILTWSLKLNGVQTTITQLSLFSKQLPGHFKGNVLSSSFLANPAETALCYHLLVVLGFDIEFLFSTEPDL